MNELRIATRRSTLARAQASKVAQMLTTAFPELNVRLVEVVTTGDKDLTGPITRLSEAGAFVRAVQQAVLSDRADIAVHSLKDLPVVGPDGLSLVALPERASPFDVLVGARLEALRRGASVGTGSPRRSAQLLGLRPDLHPTEIRGNVSTRIRKVTSGEYQAAVLAEAGLERLGQGHHIAQRFETAEMVPAPGQGTLAVEARSGSGPAELARSIDDTRLRPLIETERLLLAETAAGCRSALGALATWVEGDQIRLEVFVSDEGGPRRTVVHGAEPAQLVSDARKEINL